ncbi:DUF3040 domain-containing protein [Arthrobacter sp. Soc17.1.1.1]|uniref:DUF3040 domain-containing protein n=1 Tax=Arthrobacter sp. Soc17.1.1.1 TaxID=3121277 RepID=UPI002FE4F147
MDWLEQPDQQRGSLVSLSKHERQVWNELERVLADDLPFTSAGARPPLPHSSAGFLPPGFHRIALLITALMTGVWLLIIGALAHLFLLAVTGLIVICVAVDRLQRTAPGRTGPHRDKRNG